MEESQFVTLFPKSVARDSSLGEESCFMKIISSDSYKLLSQTPRSDEELIEIPRYTID